MSWILSWFRRPTRYSTLDCYIAELDSRSVSSVTIYAGVLKPGRFCERETLHYKAILSSSIGGFTYLGKQYLSNVLTPNKITETSEWGELIEWVNATRSKIEEKDITVNVETVKGSLVEYSALEAACTTP